MLTEGDEIDATIEKPAAGGRMIARHDGQILLVAGVIPGERVSVRIERVEKRLAFASAVRILAPSSDRRDAGSDPLCGGCVYAHIAYPRQVALKAEIVADAFTRIGRIPIERSVPVAVSPEAGYRMRARLHVRGDAAGFYRENTHEVCDPRQTHQLLGESMDAIDAALATLGDARGDVASLELSENMAADERAFHLDVIRDARELVPALTHVITAAGLTGCTARGRTGTLVRAGDPGVADPLAALTQGRAESGHLRRHPTSFFQGNRFLLPDLVVAVLDATPSGGRILDLYAGVGLFSMALAATGRDGITAVEGDRQSAADLNENAGSYPSAVRVLVGRVEDHVARRRETADTVIVDPPRSGISRDAMEIIARHGARRIIYVSCDPPTMARDARRLLDGGYHLTSVRGFDLFPNTPHVETVGVFDR
jgi:tRNA/tmRNA/rRNA uracil-C5-methylase (TrmA/RlmC/RlmD family)